MLSIRSVVCASAVACAVATGAPQPPHGSGSAGLRARSARSWRPANEGGPAVSTTTTAAAAVAAAAGPNPPEQLHLALKGDAGSYDFVASWLTRGQPSAAGGALVRFGPAADQLDRNATGTTRQYYKSFNHDAVLAGLNASTTYFYTVGSDADGWSPVFNFTTAPAHPADAAAANALPPWKVCVYGDMGVTNAEDTVARLKDHQDEFALVLHNGDFSYADDRLPFKDYEEVWNSWQNTIEFLAATRPYMVCPGNHEASCHSVGDFFCPKEHDNFTAYRYRFRMPSAESGANSENMWHSFDYGNAHFIMMDTETDVTKAPEGHHTLWNAGPFDGAGVTQLDWLKADLAKAKANRAQRPWIIVLGHRPMYTTSLGSDALIWPNVTGLLRADIEDMLADAEVDLFIGAHVHGYEATLPVLHGKPTSANFTDPPSLTHLVVGMAGNIEGHQGSKWNATKPDWFLYRDGENYGYSTLEFLNASTLRFEFREAVNDTTVHAFTLVRTTAHGL